MMLPSLPGDAVRARCLETRLAKARAMMHRERIDVLVAFGSGAHSFLAMNPAWYLSGFKPMGSYSAVVVARDEVAFLITTPEWDAERAQEQSAIEVLSAVPTDRFFDALSDELRRRGLSQAYAASAGCERQSHQIARSLQSLFARPLADCAPQLSRLARIRDEWSLACARRAAAIAEEGYERLLSLVRHGVFEHEIAAETEGYIRSLGAEDNFQLFSASQHNRSVKRPTWRRIAEGDVLLAEISPAVHGEYVQICRTAVLGTPSREQREAFDLLSEALRAGMRAALPGVPVAKVVAEMNAPIIAAGFRQYTVPPYMRTRGHSMGLGSMDPEIATASDQVLEQGVVFVMHPNQYLPATGYLMCGEPVRISTEGAEPLTSKLGHLRSIDVRESS